MGTVAWPLDRVRAMVVGLSQRMVLVSPEREAMDETEAFRDDWSDVVGGSRFFRDRERV